MRTIKEVLSKLLKEMVENGEVTPQSALRDILTDLRHLALGEELDFPAALEGSEEVFLAEFTQRRIFTKNLWVYDEAGQNCYFFPANWAEEFHDPKNCDEPELYGYYPTHAIPNSPVEVGYVAWETVRKLKSVSEEEARKLHPNLARYLDAINATEKGGIHPDDQPNFWELGT